MAADDISSTNWSETAASNTTAGATGWAANSAPSTAYTVMRDKMAAIKRWFNRVGPTITSVGTNTITLTYTTAPNGYVQGDTYSFIAGGNNSGATTLNINSLGAKNVTKNGTTALAGGEILTGAVVTVMYDGTQFQLTDGVLSSAFTGGTLTSTLVMNGAAINEADATVASAGTINIGAAAGNTINITGTTTITAGDSVQAGTIRFLRFAGILTFTHNGTSFILPNNGSNITTAAGDTAVMQSLGSGNWKCLSYQKANGQALQGSATTSVVTVKQQNFTASGTYTPSTGMLYCMVEMVGGGGGGGGGSTTQGGAGGGAGQYSRALLTAAQIGASKAITIPAAAGGGATTVAGSNGGTVSLGVLCTAGGGSGGSSGAGIVAGGAGGSGGTSDIASTGMNGTVGTSTTGYITGGAGGSTIFGGGGPTQGTAGGGNAGTGFGSGGGGAQGVNTGGAGTKGVVYITEYCSQ